MSPFRRLSPRERLRYIIPTVRLVSRQIDSADDPWVRVRVPNDHRLVAAGSLNQFEWYFDGESRVVVQSLEDICNFLRACQYASDPDVFHVPDFWQHPKTFEALRKGDCEDHALWAWRKLRELGIPAELFVGSTSTHPERSHAWVTCSSGGETYLLESVQKGDGMVLPLHECASRYLPFFSVDHEPSVYMYAGLLDWMNERRALRKAQRSASPPAA